MHRIRITLVYIPHLLLLSVTPWLTFLPRSCTGCPTPGHSQECFYLEMCILAVRESSLSYGNKVLFVGMGVGNGAFENSLPTIWSAFPYRYTLVLWHPLCALATHNYSRCSKPFVHLNAFMPLYILLLYPGIPLHPFIPCRIPSHPSNSKSNIIFSVKTSL